MRVQDHFPITTRAAKRYWKARKELWRLTKSALKAWSWLIVPIAVGALILAALPMFIDLPQRNIERCIEANGTLETVSAEEFDGGTFTVCRYSNGRARIISEISKETTP